MKRDSAAAPKIAVFEPYAWNLIKAYFGWNMDGVWNKREQICALGGAERGNRVIVKSALPLLSAASSASHVKVTGDIWMLAMWMLDDMGMKLIGSIHSHPHELGIFLSHEDTDTHLKLFPGGISAVINPQKKAIEAFDRNGGKVSVRLPDKKLKGINSTVRKPQEILYNGI